MKKLILKGLGKAKVRRIVKQFLIDSYNEYLDHGNDFFSLHGGGIVDGYGLPDMNDDYPFTLDDLTEFLNNKI